MSDQTPLIQSDLTHTALMRLVPEAPSAATRIRRAILGRDGAIILLLIVVWIVGSATVNNFNTPLTVYYLLLDVFPILLIALPMTLVIISSEIDLSVASMMGLSSVIVGALFQAGVPVWLACIISLAVGVVGGMLNGFLVTVLGLPSLAVTVGTLALYRGIAVGILGTTAVTGFPDMWGEIVKARLFGPKTAVPSIIIVFVVLAILFIVLLHFTRFGRALYSTGLNEEASRFSGIRVPRLKFWLFVATGVISAFAGLFFTFYYDSARGDNALGLELSVVAAVLVGGVSIFGGRGALPGVIAGVLVIGALRSVLRLADVSDDVINVAIGLLLVISVLIPSLLTALRKLRGRGARSARSASTS